MIKFWYEDLKLNNLTSYSQMFILVETDVCHSSNLK